MNQITPVTIAQTNDQEIIASLGLLSNASVISLGNVTNSILEFTRAGIVRQSQGRFFYASSNDPLGLTSNNLK
ncbi:hypothetical protein [Polynucleobacter antarcticus]|uniref:hypothetical protein n=1 Tax=Polynucleobacter antarcticus TaxID=1743162 RepID=UPI00156E0988|nr:hypothetical protein [Polynucleobacter antarcticus]